MKQIEKMLKTWRESRNINTLSETLKDDLQKEVIEAQQGLEKEDINNYCEEVVDVAIFAFNAIGVLNQAYSRQTSIRSEIKLIHIENTINQIDLSRPIQMRTLLCMIIGMCEDLVTKRGFDFKALTLEKIKVLESRKQCPEQKKDWALNGMSGKWEKDSKQDKDTLYKINFDKCKFNYQK